MEKRLLLGDEAIALGAIHAGLSGVYAYPGTPSTEITEFIQTNAYAREQGIRSRWCTNEKTAMEAALGMSYAGKRALVICTVSDHILTGEATTAEQRQNSFTNMMDVAFDIIAQE